MSVWLYYLSLSVRSYRVLGSIGEWQYLCQLLTVRAFNVDEIDEEVISAVE